MQGGDERAGAEDGPQPHRAADGSTASEVDRGRQQDRPRRALAQDVPAGRRPVGLPDTLTTFAGRVSARSRNVGAQRRPTSRVAPSGIFWLLARSWYCADVSVTRPVSVRPGTRPGGRSYPP